MLGHPVAIEGSPIAPRTVHLRGVPGKAKQFSYGCTLVLNDPSPEVVKRVAHIFRHVLLEGQNGFQNYVAARALMHLTVDRYETFANLVTGKGVAMAAAKKAAKALHASGSISGGIADTASAGGDGARAHGASNAVQSAYVELPLAIMVNVHRPRLHPREAEVCRRGVIGSLKRCIYGSSKQLAFRTCDWVRGEL